MGNTVGYTTLQRLKTEYTLATDDTMPIVLLLTGNDLSSTHSVTVYQSNIYNSTSRYVLHKTAAAMNWCCEKYEYLKAHKAYVIVQEVRYSKKRGRSKNDYKARKDTRDEMC
jgi:hypothetical protein